MKRNNRTANAKEGKKGGNERKRRYIRETKSKKEEKRGEKARKKKGKKERRKGEGGRACGVCAYQVTE